MAIWIDSCSCDLAASSTGRSQGQWSFQRLLDLLFKCYTGSPKWSRYVRPILLCTQILVRNAPSDIFEDCTALLQLRSSLSRERWISFIQPPHRAAKLLVRVRLFSVFIPLLSIRRTEYKSSFTVPAVLSSCTGDHTPMKQNYGQDWLPILFSALS